MKDKTPIFTFWINGKYLIPFFIPIFTYLLIVIVNHNTEILGEKSIGLLWTVALSAMIIWCLKYSKPLRRYSLHLSLSILFAISPFVGIHLGILEPDFHHNLFPKNSSYVWFNGLSGLIILGIYVFRFLAKPEKNIFSILKLALILYLISLVVFSPFIAPNIQILEFGMISGIGAMILLVMIHAFEMIIWEKKRDVWITYIKEAKSKAGFSKS
ncbi:MAG: hypothetical protein AAF696_23310 [Bacteroidota bacterium]